METVSTLLNKLNGKRNPNGIFDPFTKSFICSSMQSWSTGYSFYIVPQQWGFSVIQVNGEVAPHTSVNFGKFNSEDSFIGAFNRAMDFAKTNGVKEEPLSAYLHGE